MLCAARSCRYDAYGNSADGTVADGDDGTGTTTPRVSGLTWGGGAGDPNRSMPPMAALREACAEIQFENDPALIWSRVANLATNVARAEKALVYLVDEVTREVKLTAVSNQDDFTMQRFQLPTAHSSKHGLVCASALTGELYNIPQGK